MKLSDVIEYINIALNYPALAYNDISLYFDMAIAELNTTLHTAIPLVSKMVERYRDKITDFSNTNDDVITLTSDPALNNYEIPVSDTTTPETPYDYFYCSADSKYYVKVSSEYVPHDKLTGIRFLSTGPEVYEAIYYGSNTAGWVKNDILNITDCEISDYLPNDWVLLWLIPYVCYKYTVRDGGTAQTFAEELTQGHQQLQDTYDVPDKVLLATYADKAAYTEIVEKLLPNLDVYVQTQAIYPSMKHERNINAIFGSFYDRGGF